MPQYTRNYDANRVKKIYPLNFYIGNLTSDEYNAILIQASQENLSLD